MSRRVAVIAFLAALALVLSIAPASADPQAPIRLSAGPWPEAVEASPPVGVSFAISRNDGNDVKGALDLRSMRIARGRTKDAISFSTHDAVSNAAIEVSTANFAVLIDTNDDRDFEFGQYVFFAAGHIRGVLFNLRSDRVVDRTAPTSRTSATSFRTVIQRGKIDSPGTYRFALFGYNEGTPCSRRDPCVDTIPNRFPLIPLDHQAPSVRLNPLAVYSVEDSPSLTAPASLTVEDDRFGTGVKSWRLQRRVAGTSGWTTIEVRRASAATVDVAGDEGVTLNVRVVAIDKQGNKRVSAIRRTTFPFDDRNAEVAFEGTLALNDAVPGAFLDTTTTLAQNTTATFTFDVPTSGEVCIMGGPPPGLAGADLIIDGGAGIPLTEDASTAARALLECRTLFAGSHTVVLESTDAGGFVLDGIAVRT
jgi:hypothetical protein